MDARSYETASRSDAMILASYNKQTHSVKLVSFLRDSWVHLPEYGWSRINTATAYGGVGLLVNTLNENFDLDIQHYVQIRFEGFREVIDILGGIDVELTQSEINYINRKLHVEDKDWKSADEYCEKVLDLDAECAEAYLGKLMVDLKVPKKELLKDCPESFGENPNYKKILLLGSKKIAEELQLYNQSEGGRVYSAKIKKTIQLGSVD